MTSPQIKKASSKAHSAVDKAADAAATLELQAREKAEQLREAATERVDAAKTASSDAQEKVTAYVHENPLKALGIAFGAGIIASVLLRR